MPHLLVLEARYYTEINDNLLKGVEKACTEVNATFDVVSVPGSYELPAALNLARRSKTHYDGFVLLGCVIRGATSHYDHICDSVFQTVQDLVVAHDLSVGQGILTCETYDQAFERADPTHMNYGGKAAKAALTMAALKQKLCA
jgi:6,7-dimethyl-8-ribityllumazine synthase